MRINEVLAILLLCALGACARRAEMPPETTYSPELKLRAEQGDLRSQHQLGVVLMQGAGVPENAEEGFRWVGKASQKNYAPSQFLCGIILRTTGSNDQGLELIKRAAEQGLPEAQMSLGLIYLGGSGVPKDIEQAIYWFREAGEGGNGDAFTNLGYIYWEGNGVPKNRRKGAGYFKKAANMGFLHGQNDYAWFLATSPEAEDRNGREAVRWAERAVRQRRDCTTLDTLASAYAEDGQFEKAVETQKEAIQKLKKLDEETLQEWEILQERGQLAILHEAEMRLRLYQEGMPFREPTGSGNDQEKRPADRQVNLPSEKLKQKASEGDSRAQYDLALSYLTGAGTEKNLEKAMLWMSRAAELGYAPAQCQWGFMLYQAQRFPEAAQFYRKSADQGYGEGLYNLAVCYERGHGVRQDQELAANYYLKAAQKGVSQAMYNLAQFYLHGVGVKKDRQEAEKWLVQASEGYPPARVLLQKLRGNNSGQAEKRELSAGADAERLDPSEEEKFSDTERRAREGDPRAQCNLGAFYLQGRGVQRDDTKGFQWMKKAADAGDGLAQLNLAGLYERGRGVRRNAKLSVAMLEQAFANGQAEAGYLLGLRYLYGNGVDQMPEEARKIWEKSARMGDASSQEALEKSRTLEFGDGSMPKYRLPPIPNPGRSLRPETDIPGGLYLRAFVDSSDGYVNLRAGQGVGRKVIEKIYRDEEVFVKVSDGEWWPCVFMPLDLTGYVHRSGIRNERQGPAIEVVSP